MSGRSQTPRVPGARGRAPGQEGQGARFRVSGGAGAGGTLGDIALRRADDARWPAVDPGWLRSPFCLESRVHSAAAWRPSDSGPARPAQPVLEASSPQGVRGHTSTRWESAEASPLCPCPSVTDEP